jgi:hypothetical protein
LLLLHAPPTVPSVKEVVAPIHTLTAPAGVMAPGFGLTVNTDVVWQPAPMEYVTNEVPADTPPAIPDEVPMVATATLELVHVPPPEASVKEVFDPMQTLSVPLIGATLELTVSVVVA